MVRLIYSLLLYLALPLVGLRLLWRSRRQPAYREHLGERWGFYPPRASQRPLLWLHAVSVGETRAAQPLVQALLAAYPDHDLLLTCMTPTGRDTGREVYGQRVIQAYLPYDYPDAVARFLAHFQPRLGVLMETELWPNLLAACAARRLPVVLANARLSARSAAGYARFAALARPAFAALGACAAQTPADAARLRQLGTADVTVCGNLKFDVTPAAEKRALGREWKAALAGRPVWLAASTREGEELPLLEAWQAALQRMLQPDPQSPLPLLVLVPRHPQRFDEVAALVRRQGLWLGRRSAGLPDARCQVWLGDSMGEMPAYYTLADLAFIGGSLLPLGGQNLIEAAACACPVLIGPHTFNFTQATEDALAAGAARRVQTATELVAEVEALLGAAASRQQMVAAAEEFASAHRGATERTLALIARCYPAAR